MQAGRLDRRVTIQRATSAQDPVSGDVALTFADWKQKWAQRRLIRGREALEAQQLVATAECEYLVRDDTDTRTLTANETFRLRDRDRLYDILGAEPSEKRGDHIVLRVRGRAEAAP